MGKLVHAPEFFIRLDVLALLRRSGRERILLDRMVLNVLLVLSGIAFLTSLLLAPSSFSLGLTDL